MSLRPLGVTARLGSIFQMLPIFFVAAGLGAASLDDYRKGASSGPGPEKPHLGLVYTGISPSKEGFDDVAKALGYPALTSGYFNLYGMGAGFAAGDLRLDAQAVQGSLGAVSGSRYTDYSLRLASLTMEQRYGGSSVLITAGMALLYGELDAALSDGPLLTRFLGKGYGGTVTAGARWPAQTRLGLMLRSGYQWLPISGNWQGSLAGLSTSKNYYDLGGIYGQAVVELGF